MWIDVEKQASPQGKKCGDFLVPVLSSRCCFLGYDQIKIPTNGIKGGKCDFMEDGSKIKDIRWGDTQEWNIWVVLFDYYNSISLWNKNVIYHRSVMSLL